MKKKEFIEKMNKVKNDIEKETLYTFDILKVYPAEDCLIDICRDAKKFTVNNISKRYCSILEEAIYEGIPEWVTHDEDCIFKKIKESFEKHF